MYSSAVLAAKIMLCLFSGFPGKKGKRGRDASPEHIDPRRTP
jgi:hypothetical protein